MAVITEEKKGFKNTDIGLIPEDWELIKIGDVLEFKNGLNKAKEYFGRGTPIINYMDVFRHPGLTEELINGKVTLSKAEIRRYNIQKGDVFFTRTSETVDEIGISTVLEESIEDGVYSGFVLRGRPISDRLGLKFKRYCFSSNIVRQQIISSATYTTRALTNGRHLSKVKIPVPPFEEQQAIASALSDVDELIRSLDRLIEKKEAIKKGTMQQLLTGKKRLSGFDGEWERKKLGDLFEKIVGGGTPSRIKSEYWNGNIPWATVKDFRTFRENGTQESITKGGLLNSSSNLIPKGTVITSTRMGLGQAVIYDVDVAINQDLKAIFTNKQLLPDYLFYWFSANKEEIESLGSGSTVKGISLGDLKGFETLITESIEEQKAIAQILSDMDRELQTLRQKREKYKQVKQGMMQELLTGKTRLI